MLQRGSRLMRAVEAGKKPTTLDPVSLAWSWPWKWPSSKNTRTLMLTTFSELNSGASI